MIKIYSYIVLLISFCSSSLFAQYDLLYNSKIVLPFSENDNSLNDFGENILSITITPQNDIFIEVNDKNLAKEIFGDNKIYGFFNPDNTMKNGFESTGLINGIKTDNTQFKEISGSEEFSNIILNFRKHLKKKNNNPKIEFTYLVNQDKNSGYWLYVIASDILIDSKVSTIFLNGINNEKKISALKTALVDFSSGTVPISVENNLFIRITNNNEITMAKAKGGKMKVDDETFKKQVQIEDNDSDTIDFEDKSEINDLAVLAPEFIGDIPENGDKISITDLKIKLEEEFSKNKNLIIALYFSPKLKYKAMIDILNMIYSANIAKRYVIMPNESK